MYKLTVKNTKRTKEKTKFLALIFLIITVISTFASCFSVDNFINLFINEEDIAFYFDYNELAENVEKAEIVYVENFSYGGSGTIIVEKTLNHETTLMLIEDFSKIQYISPVFGSPPEPNGYCIRLWYKDGTYEIYGVDGTTARWAWCTDSEQFYGLIEKYK